jgi:hypothetical protein
MRMEEEPGWLSRYSDGLEVQGSIPARGKRFFCSPGSRPDKGPTQPPIESVLGSPSSGIKRPGSEADHLPPSSAKVNKSSWRSA